MRLFACVIVCGAAMLAPGLVTLGPFHASAAPRNGVHDPLSDPWEWDNRDLPQSAGCIRLSDTLVAPVLPSERAAAISRLLEAPFVPLQDSEAAQLIGALAPATGESLATSILRRDVARRPQSYVSEGNGHLVVDGRPFLVRAILKNESGAFTVEVCGDVVRVINEPFGASESRSRRTAVVVFLPQAPDHVNVTWSTDR